MKYQGKRVQIRTRARYSEPRQYGNANRLNVLFKPRLAAARQEVNQTTAWSETRETDLELVLKQRPLERSTNISMPQNESGSQITPECFFI